MLKMYLMILMLFLSNALFCSGQNTIDLTVKTQVSDEIVRGGEKYTVLTTITNNGTRTSTKTAADFTLNTLASFANILGGTDCKITSRNQEAFCRLGEIKPGESIVINLEIKVAEFGDFSLPPRQDNKTSQAIKNLLLKTESDKNQAAINDAQGEILVGFGSVYSDDKAIVNLDDDNFRFQVTALPSRNAPPRVEIIEPAAESVYFVNPGSNFSGIPIRVKAYDPDGSIISVTSNRQDIPFIVEDNIFKYIINNKKYTEEKIKSNPAYFRPFFETELKPVGNDIYVFTLTDFKYGKNRLSINATDNGGRSESVWIDFEVQKRK